MPARAVVIGERNNFFGRDGNTYAAYIPHADRNYGVHLLASKGHGKSRLLGKFVCWQDFTDGRPQVIFDNGDITDYFLGIASWMSEKNIKKYVKRLRYVDLSGSLGYITPFPFYYRFGSESNYQVANRFVDLIDKIDPHLRSASIQGFNALQAYAIPYGQVMVSKGWQVSELDPSDKEMPSALRAKLTPFFHDETQRAIYCASIPGIDWEQVLTNKETVILDYRHCQGLDATRLALQWSLMTFLEFIRQRGTGGSPFGLVIDELSAFTQAMGISQDAFAKDLDVLLNTTMRRHNLWVTLAHQEMNQFAFSPALQALLLGLDTQVIGKVPGIDDALMLAKQLYPIDPSKSKGTDTVWGSQEVDVRNKPGYVRKEYFPIDHRDILYTIPEQHYENARKFMELKPGHFILKRRGEEKLEAFSTRVTEDHYVNWDIPKEDAEEIRMMLLKRDGRPIAEVLAEIDSRTLQSTTVQPQPEDATGNPQPPLATTRKGKLE